MEIHITTLSENSVAAIYLLGEWGLSILVETEGMKILFDTGLSISTAYNAEVLGINLAIIDKIILSHGHRDHTGGLRDILHKTGEMEVIAHPDIWAPKYRRLKDGSYRYRGLPFRREELEDLGASFTLTREPVWLSKEIVTTGEIPMTTEYEQIDSDLYVKEDNGWRPDELWDDQALLIKTEQGLVVILGCAHRGLINTLQHAQRLTGENRIHTVIGGTHLDRTTEERVLLTSLALKELGVRRLGVSHCTGLPAAILLAQEFGESFFFNNAGTTITLP